MKNGLENFDQDLSEATAEFLALTSDANDTEINPHLRGADAQYNHHKDLLEKKDEEEV